MNNTMAVANLNQELISCFDCAMNNHPIFLTMIVGALIIILVYLFFPMEEKKQC
jgi:hypothetical protein